MSDLERFRREKDEFFAHHPQSPLDPVQRAAFTGLRYFPENPDLVFDLGLDSDVDHSELPMSTSTGGSQVYRRAGVVRFPVEGQEATLMLYESEGHAGLFVPFRDTTSGKESYGAGRYVDLPPADRGGVELDLNYAYNPYCAYNDQWSCPLPPVENWLSVPIRAGEMSFPRPEG